MPLTDEEKTTLEALQAKEKEPAETRSGGRSENFHLDVTEAVREKLLTKAEARKLLGYDDGGDGDDGGDDDGGDDDAGKKKKKAPADDDDDEGEGETPPNRRGYFK